MAPKRSSARSSATDVLKLDRKHVSTAAGALPVHTRIELLEAGGWKGGVITEAFSRLDGKNEAILYKIAFDHNGKEQEVDLREAKWLDLKIAEFTSSTPRSQRKSATQINAAAATPSVGVTNIPSPRRLNGLKLPELRKICQDLGLESKGQKKDVVAVLTRAHSAAQAMLSGELELGNTSNNATTAEEAVPMAVVEEAQTAAQSAEAKVKALEAAVDALKQQLEAERADADAARHAASESSAALTQLQAESSALEAALALAETSGDGLKKELSAKKEEVEGLTKQVLSLEEKELALQSELQELKGNVRVLCRLRPPKSQVSTEPVATATGLMASGMTRSLTLYASGGVSHSSNGGTAATAAAAAAPRTFEFDRVFGSECDTESCYEELKPLVKSVCYGGKATVLAYGQTGSGKTYTMLGMQRLAVQELLDGLAKQRRQMPSSAPSLEVRVGIVEVHNEKLTDLLAKASSSSSTSTSLELRQGKDGVSYVEGMSWHTISSADAAEGLVTLAAQRRATADNGLNDQSSRSHLVMLYQLVQSSSDVSMTGLTSTTPALRGQLTLVDLAGSERLSRTEASGTLQVETAAINKSLSALGDVMTAIADKTCSHVPYRNSKLTHLLQPALSKGARVMFIVAASPDAIDANETLISLGFGTRARNAVLGPERVARPAASSAVGGATTPGRAAVGGATTPGRAALGNGTPNRSHLGNGGGGGTPGGGGVKTTPGGGGGGVKTTPGSVHGGGTKRPAGGGGATPLGGGSGRVVKMRPAEVQ